MTGLQMLLKRNRKADIYSTYLKIPLYNTTVCSLLTFATKLAFKGK